MPAIDTYEIIDGVRRAKAASMTGAAVVPARIDDGTGALGPIVQLPVDQLLSPKDNIDISTTAGFRRFKSSLDKARQSSTPPPITVIQGKRGRPIADVEFNL